MSDDRSGGPTCVARRAWLHAAPALPLGVMVPTLAQAQPGSAPLERSGGPFVPTPWAVVDQMLRMGGIGPRDFVMDLGCGDGRLVIEAAKRHGARGLGIDIDPELVQIASATAEREKVSHLVRFEVRDIVATDVSEATVLTLYLLPAMMARLQPRLLSMLRPGARIVSHDYTFGEWRADTQFSFEVPEKKAITGIPSATVLLWVVPARVAGRWRLSAPAASGLDGAELDLRQSFQGLSGQVRPVRGAVGDFDGGTVRATVVRFSLPVEVAGRRGRALFSGRAEGDRIEGMIEAAPVPVAVGRFVARRLA
jgi:SAM-dependent methyltransferase